MMRSIPVSDKLFVTLFGKTRRAVLSLMYEHADETFYLRQLTLIVGGGMGALQRELKTLMDAGIVRRIAKGKQVYYQSQSPMPGICRAKKYDHASSFPSCFSMRRNSWSLLISKKLLSDAAAGPLGDELGSIAGKLGTVLSEEVLEPKWLRGKVKKEIKKMIKKYRT